MDISRKLAIRRRPPLTPAVHAEHTFTLRLNNDTDEFTAYAYRYSGEQFNMRAIHMLKVGDTRALLDVMYDCMRLSARSATSGPLKYIAKYGGSEWLQQCLFQNIDAKTLNYSPERILSARRGFFHVPVDHDENFVDVTRPGSIVVLMLQFDARCDCITNHVSLDALVSSVLSLRPGERDADVFARVVCPLAVVPSGEAQYRLSAKAPFTLKTVASMPETTRFLKIDKWMLLYNDRVNDEEATSLYAQWFSQFLVSGNEVKIHLWPAPRGRRMRDGDVIAFSTKAAHCLLAGLVRFHCERYTFSRRFKAIALSSRKSSDSEIEAALKSLHATTQQLVRECVYTPTLLHPHMSLRQLMRELGFGGLCRTMYRAMSDSYLVSTGGKRRTILPLVRSRMEWFVETLGYLLTYVMLNETVGESENETLRFLQSNGFVDYPEINDERYVSRNEILKVQGREKSTLNTARTETYTYPIRVEPYVPVNEHSQPPAQAETEEAQEARIATFNRSLPPNEQAVRYYRSLRGGGSDNDTCLAEVLWVFSMPFDYYCIARKRSAESIRRHEIFIHDGRVILLWYHLSALCGGNEDAGSSALAATSEFCVQPGAQLWLVEFFTTLLKMPGAKYAKFEKEFSAPGLYTFVRNSDSTAIEDPFDGKVYDGDPSITSKNKLQTILRPSLLQCLPIAAGTFNPNRPRFLHDLPISGFRYDQFAKANPFDTGRIPFDTTKRGSRFANLLEEEISARDTPITYVGFDHGILGPDVVSLYHIDADSIAISRIENNTHIVGDECVMYSLRSRAYVPLDVSSILSLEPTEAEKLRAKIPASAISAAADAAAAAADVVRVVQPTVRKRKHMCVEELEIEAEKDAVEVKFPNKQAPTRISDVSMDVNYCGIVNSEDSSDSENEDAAASDVAVTAVPEVAIAMSNLGVNVIEALSERGMIAPCLMMCQRAFKDPKRGTYPHPNRLEDGLQYQSMSPFVDIEDIAVYYVNVTAAHPMRKTKVDEYVRDIRGTVDLYKKKMSANVTYQVKKYGEARNCSGALSCVQIASEAPQKVNGALIRCPYAQFAKSGDDAALNASVGGKINVTPEQRKYLRGGGIPRVVCLSHLGGGDEIQSLCMHYPRDYTRAALHLETLKQKAQQSSSTYFK